MKTQVTTLVYGEDETHDSRLASLITLGNSKIPEQRHQNVGTVTYQRSPVGS